MSIVRLIPASGAMLGDLAHIHALPPAGSRARLDPWFRNDRAGAQLRVSLAGVAPSALPLTVSRLERHPASSQTFLPIQAGPWLACMAPSAADGRPDAARGLAVLLDGGQGLTYAPGTWHLELTTIERPGHFAVMIWRTDEPGDDEFASLPAPLEIHAG